MASKYPAFVRVPRSFYEGQRSLVHQNTYIHPNPIVRWLFWSRLESLLALPKGHKGIQRVLDFGCGEGALLPTLSARYPHVTGVDLDIAASEAVVAHYSLDNVELVSGSVLDPEVLRGRQFDLIVAADVLEHFRDVAAPLERIAGLLAPGGMLLVSGPSENWFYSLGRAVFGFTKPADHYHSADEIRQAMRAVLEMETCRFSPALLGGLAPFVLMRARSPIA